MFRNKVYYRIKPLLPFSIRMGVRRWFALRKRRRVRTIWPILPGSEKPPEGWTGWPDGKQFALVLTHDVEGQSGVDKCRQLMELEMKCGFRSSFNFVPEGEYRVSSELRAELIRNGFEVGVHDLHHDGKLYSSRQQFARKAVQINRYIKEWGAVGFRSGFMLHELDWLHDLEIQYDASTFDTDPFEPQPDGVGTIFPFWVPKPGTATGDAGHVTRANDSLVTRHLSPVTRQGYVELPYTLPQDSTLFFVLRETSPAIWIQKLDWVAARGGMVLLNTHPDYVAFDGASPSSWDYSSRFYEQVLEHIKTRYPGAYWHALPRQVAAYYVRNVLTLQTETEKNSKSPSAAKQFQHK